MNKFRRYTFLTFLFGLLLLQTLMFTSVYWCHPYFTSYVYILDLDPIYSESTCLWQIMWHWQCNTLSPLNSQVEAERVFLTFDLVLICEINVIRTMNSSCWLDRGDAPLVISPSHKQWFLSHSQMVLNQVTN